MNFIKSHIWILTIIILGLVLLGFQIQLKKTADKGSSHKIILWHSYTGKEATALKQLVSMFNQNASLNEGYHIEMLSVSFGNFSDKLTNSLPRGQGPDLFIYAHDRLEDWMSKKLITPVDYWVTTEFLNKFEPSVTLDAFIRNGKLYGLPLTAKNLALYYRVLPNQKDIGAEIRKLQSKNQWDIKHFLNLMKSLTGKCSWNNNLKCFGLGYLANDAYHHALWLHAYGGKFISKNNIPQIVTQAGIKAAQLLYKLAGHHKNAVVPPELSYPLMSDLFKKGEIATVISGPWFLSQLNKQDFKFGVTYLPSVNNRNASPFLSVEGIYMSAKCRHPKISFKVMKFLAGEKSVEIRAIKAGQLPILNNIKTKLISECTNNPHCSYKTNFYDVFAKIAKSAVLMPASKEARIIWPPYSKALSAIIGRGISPRKALEEADWEINKYLGACLRKDK